MPRTSKISLYALAGAFGGAAAWVFVLALSNASPGGLRTELLLGALSGMFIGAFIWSHEAIAGRQFKAAIQRAAFGGAAGVLGGALGAALGNTVFTALGKFVADAGGFRASAGLALAVGLGWAVLGAAVGLSGGIMARSRERALYGLTGGSLGGLIGGLVFYGLSATSLWSSLAGLFLLGMSIGAFISLVEEAFVSAKVKVIKGRHINREFPLLKDVNVVGRDDRSDVCLSGAEGVGMHHAVIRRQNGHFAIESDEEGKVVYVNQKMTRSSNLHDGDVIRVGSILLMFNAVRKAAAVVIAAGALFIGLFIGPNSAIAGEPASMKISQFDLSGFPAVKAYVSILDKDGKPVRGLDQRILSLKENGLPANIRAMSMAGTGGHREPLSIALVIDRSGSMAGEKLARAKESVLRFLSLMESGDRAALFAFSDTVTELAPLTDNIESLKAAVRGIEADGHTALYDAIARGVVSLRAVPGRKAVIVLTDGIANRGAIDIDQAIAAGSESSVSVYTIGIGNDVRTARLERIADETGGTYFFTPLPDRLVSIYETISHRIKNEYVLTYDTDRRGEFLRTVSLELKGGPVAERAYFQPQSSLFGAAGRPPGWAYGVPLAVLLGLIAISLRKMEREYKTAHLSLVRGSGTRKDIDIRDTVTIGRDERSTIGLLKDDDVSRRHAELLKENGRYIVEDKGSATGTFVNKKKVTGRQALKDGDIIDVGKATIVFSEGGARTCTDCGEPIRAEAKFCPKCGLKAA
jgi:VWFA-related protein